MTSPPTHDPWNTPDPQQPPRPQPIHADEHVRPELASTVALSKRAARIRKILAWNAIVFCTVLIAGAQYVAASSQPAGIEDERPGLEATYIGRVSVGFHELINHADPQLLAELDQIAKRSAYPVTGQLRSAIVAGEINGPDEAIARLAQHQPLRLTGAETGNYPEIDRDHQLLTQIYSDSAYLPDASERQQLIDRHGWFGKLAAGYNNPKTDTLYAGPRQSAMVVAAYITAAVLGVMLAMLVGVGLLITLTLLLTSGKLAMHHRVGPAAHPTAYLESVALFLACFLLLQGVGTLLLHTTGVNLTWLMLVLMVLPIFWPKLCGVSWQALRRDMGWITRRAMFREIGAGVVGYIAGLPIIAVGIGITFLLTKLTQSQASHPIGQELLHAGIFQILLLVFAAVVWAPLVEESIFRAAFYSHLRTRRVFSNWLITTLITSFIFAVIHPQGYAGVPALMSIAFVLAMLREWRGSLVPCVTAHALNNGVLIFSLLVVFYV